MSGPVWLGLDLSSTPDRKAIHIRCSCGRWHDVTDVVTAAPDAPRDRPAPTEELIEKVAERLYMADGHTRPWNHPKTKALWHTFMIRKARVAVNVVRALDA